MAQLEVLQQKLEHWCAASIRAIANEPTIHYRGHFLNLNGQPYPIRVAHLQLDADTKDYRHLRGVADGIAVRLLFSDHDLHQELRPDNNLQSWIFELLEQLRAESLAPAHLPGMKENIRKRFLYWADQANASDLTESHAGMMVFTLAITAWSRLFSLQPPHHIEEHIESTRMSFGSLVGKQLRDMKRLKDDQLAYSVPALEVAEIIQQQIKSLSLVDDDDDNSEDDLDKLINKNTTSLRLLYTDGADVDQANGVAGINEIANMEFDLDYKVFSTAFDQVVDMSKKIRVAQLKHMRETLDKRIKQQSVNIPRLARYFAKSFAVPKLSGWDFGKEEGYLDAGSLTRLITSPEDRKLFRQEAEKPLLDCVVTVLIDNSGSMGQHSHDIAILVDTLIRALELSLIKTEVLGFTTGEWNGGKVHKQWTGAGSPKNPGRLNSLSHNVYKTADTSWRRSRQTIAGLLKSDLYRESVDGEALEWAYGRISQRSEKRRIIMVISDGSPMDTMTHYTNVDRYLDMHLKQVANRIEQSSNVHLCALGVGLDLSAYYRQSLMILDKELDNKAYFEIADLITHAD
jgi:cobaltochelatase CobT